jgi:hypothetical protein
VIRVGRALSRLADELTAVLGGLLGYAAVLAALGVGVIYLLDMTVSAATEPEPRSAQATVERPYVITDDRIAGLDQPELRRAVAK